MCGIFGLVGQRNVDFNTFHKLALLSRSRGQDSSGLSFFDSQTCSYQSVSSSISIDQLLKRFSSIDSSCLVGHSRLITNGTDDNQPVVRDGSIVIHNGIIVNTHQLWSSINKTPSTSVDSEILCSLFSYYNSHSFNVQQIETHLNESVQGTVSCAVLFPSDSKLYFYSNNGSLFLGYKENTLAFASEYYFLASIGCVSIQQITNKCLSFDIPESHVISSTNMSSVRSNYVPSLGSCSREEALLRYSQPNLRRCTKCILPETMPYISFDAHGVCNYCRSYNVRNQPRPLSDLLEILKPYRRPNSNDCIIPFSGGRDSCFTLHLACKLLDLNPITYTYDWGMVTDLGRRNISRMCSQLGVENIIFAANIEKKRRNIRRNLVSWLKDPDLGMVSILTAGDKHFFRYVEDMKKRTSVNLNLWGINPLEVTHFKSGFLGLPPNFAEKRVYSTGFSKQVAYQVKRFKKMTKSPGYFNSSIFDTLSGEYYRTFFKKSDYYHLFDFYAWDEFEIDQVLLNVYDWEIAPDTSTTWRIGDGTAAFYNYIYYTVAGFTEHDTFRSNQIREGQISRENALELVLDENRPRYPNIKWYLNILHLDFESVINAINSIPPLYSPC